jgi:hypothetical protein
MRYLLAFALLIFAASAEARGTHVVTHTNDNEVKKRVPEKVNTRDLPPPGHHAKNY